ncbi:hypothetical protein EZV62_001357 [Acer yangbiense]|uniref:Myb-like domain-containing protein n=1 Tax=Acer yangbiense TaxID=1000413 RepID=A0A5C7IUL0_9ROSI|nr:hypothetical protein EZV62_001357 [Acer yangbiense]
MANPPGVHQEQNHASSSFSGGPNHNNTNSVIERTSACMKHNPGISPEWTAEEHRILEDGLRQFPSDTNLIRYAKIATLLQNKTVRDVALRCRWMALRFKKENSKRRKEDSTRKSKDKKERVIDSSANPAYFTLQPNVPSYATPRIPTDCDDGIPCRGQYLDLGVLRDESMIQKRGVEFGFYQYVQWNRGTLTSPIYNKKAIGGAMGEILEQNAQVIHQISANLESLQIEDNIELFCQTRDNIVKILNNLNDMPEKMRQMPPLPRRQRQRRRMCSDDSGVNRQRQRKEPPRVSAAVLLRSHHHHTLQLLGGSSCRHRRCNADTRRCSDDGDTKSCREAGGCGGGGGGGGGESRGGRPLKPSVALCVAVVDAQPPPSLHIWCHRRCKLSPILDLS